jgi:hypothetical protein
VKRKVGGSSPLRHPIVNKIMNKKVIFGVSIIIVLAGVGLYAQFYQQRSPLPKEITNFDDCEQAGYPVGESYPRQCWTPDGRNFVEELESGIPPALGPITISGEMTCLPKVGAGAQTLECAIGLEATDGNNYGLKNLFNVDPEYSFSRDGLRVEVSGTLLEEEMQGPDGNRYDIVGVIDVTSIKEIGN